MEIVRERLEREFDLNLITTAPSVKYRVTQTNGKIQEIDNPCELPPAVEILSIEEPWLSTTLDIAIRIYRNSDGTMSRT